VLDCDVQSFFDKVSQDWLIRFVEHRIGDRRIIRLIAKWLTAGVFEEGRVIETEEGTPQGAVISPLLANIYLRVRKGLSLHGLRKAACRRLAEAGCTPHEIMAISGHTTLKEVTRYTNKVDRKHMARAAMKRLRGTS
jgi:retron-type reverse transcriptase